MDLSIPGWGQVSIAGALLGIVVWVVVAVLSGRLVTRSRLEDEQKHTAEANERSDKWQEAYQASQSVNLQWVDVVSRFTALADVFEAFMNALPRLEEGGGEDDGYGTGE